MPDEDLEKLSEEELVRLLEPLIPAARKINPEFASSKNQELMDKLSKLMGI